MSVIELIGNETAPVIIFDDWVTQPEFLVDDAAMLSFAPMGIHCPGIRARVSQRILAPMLRDLAPTIADVFGYKQIAIADAFYSLVTTQPTALTPIQRIPHFDGVEPERLALLHYLAPEVLGGTAFYRHRATSFESVTPNRLQQYRQTLDADLAREGAPEPAYIARDTAMFEQIARFDGPFNRAILYRSNSLHCAWLPSGTAFDADPRSGRLTLNTFLDCR